MTLTNQEAYPYAYDLTNCDKEPIHHIRLVQSHFYLLAVRPSDLHIQFASANAAELFGQPLDRLLGQSLRPLLPADTARQLSLYGTDTGEAPANPLLLELPGAAAAYDLTLIPQDDLLLLEIEPANRDYGTGQRQQFALAAAVQHLQQAADFSHLVRTMAAEVRAFGGYDRVMIYRFDGDHNGEVIAEEKLPELTPYLGLHYPASDIPAQARALYLRNRTRILADRTAATAPIHAAPGLPAAASLDLSDCVSRGVSPIHLEYLGHMGVRATLSLAVVVEEKLWGLVVCHHGQPRPLNYLERGFFNLLGTVFSGTLSLYLAKAKREESLRINSVCSRLFERMSRGNQVHEGLIEGEPNLLDLNDANGCALYYEDRLSVLGKTPAAAEIQQLIGWLQSGAPQTDGREIFLTDRLAQHYAPAEKLLDSAAGLLAIAIHPEQGEYILWFKPEERQTVNWGGDPGKKAVFDEVRGRISPRKSFDSWAQVVEGRSLPWPDSALPAARLLCDQIRDVITANANELKAINRQLQRAYEEMESFSYSVSHDLRSPLRAIAGFSQILEEDYHDKLDEEGKETIQVIQQSVKRMGSFIDGILHYGRITYGAMKTEQIDLVELTRNVWADLSTERTDCEVDLTIADNLPAIRGDAQLIYRLMLNLLGNAIKYRCPERSATIHLGYDEEKTAWFIRDNGIGFDDKQQEQVFAMFTRLVPETYADGSGVGMAIVKRIVNMHGGKVWAESRPDEGAAFFFTVANG
ncbi:MAG: ATP-binding protein [Saprospiraceae bacterium]